MQSICLHRGIQLWPALPNLCMLLFQSLEAYYQEAGRAGRDGKLADCSKFITSLEVRGVV